MIVCAHASDCAPIASANGLRAVALAWLVRWRSQENEWVWERRRIEPSGGAFCAEFGKRMSLPQRAS